VNVRACPQNRRLCTPLTTSNRRRRLVAIVTRRAARRANQRRVTVGTIRAPAPLTATTTTHVRHLLTLFACGRGAKYCDERVCMSVCSHILKTTCPDFSNFLCMLTVMAVARCFSDDTVIRYVLPVLWMTSCLSIIGLRRVLELTHQGAELEPL